MPATEQYSIAETGEIDQEKRLAWMKELEDLIGREVQKPSWKTIRFLVVRLRIKRHVS